MKARYTLFAVILGVIASVLLSGCDCYAVRYDGPHEGKVVDAETGQPIEGVVVLGVWYKEYATIAGATHRFHDAKETVTDKNGDFLIRGMGLEIFSNVIPMDVLIFKAGYEHLSTPWTSLKESKYLIQKKNIRWEENKVIIPIRKVTLRERKTPDSPPTEAPLEKIKLYLNEMNKDRVERNLEPYSIWRGEKI